VREEVIPHLVAYFVMVARRNGVNEAYPIPPLDPISPLEKRHYHQGASNAARRKEAAANSLLIQPPKADEIKIVHEMFARQMHQGTKAFILYTNTRTRHTSMRTLTRQTHAHVRVKSLITELYVVIRIDATQCERDADGQRVPLIHAVDSPAGTDRCSSS
jgi:hypothetical protein